MTKGEKKEKSCVVKTRKFMTNRLLCRKQFVVDILHPGRKCLTHKELTEKLMKMYKVQDPNTVYVFGFKHLFGGGKTTGFALIYDTVQDAKKFEPKFRLVRKGLLKKVEKSRRDIKQKKS